MKVWVTRPQAQAINFAELIRQQGWQPQVLPTLEINSLEAYEQKPLTLAEFAAADVVIFTSANAVYYACRTLSAPINWPSSTKLIAIGHATQRALLQQGIAGASLPQIAYSEAVLALPELRNISGQAVLIISGVGGRGLLARELSSRGGAVQQLACYQRGCPKYSAEQLMNLDFDVSTITSIESLQNLFAILAGRAKNKVIQQPMVVLSPRIAAAARGFGVEYVLTAAEPSDAAMLAALKTAYTRTLS